jgi:hypothetical protein
MKVDKTVEINLRSPSSSSGGRYQVVITWRPQVKREKNVKKSQIHCWLALAWSRQQRREEHHRVHRLPNSEARDRFLSQDRSRQASTEGGKI